MPKTKKLIFYLLRKIFIVYIAIMKDYYYNCVIIYMWYGK